MQRLVALLLLLRATGAAAHPFLALRPGGSPFEGPTDAEISSLWWNPAAIGPMRGVHIAGTGQLDIEHGAIDRAAICSATGLPATSCTGNTISFPRTSIAGVSGTALAGASWDFKTDNVVAAFGVYAPWESHRSFGGSVPGSSGAGSTPTAYHLRSEDFTTIYYTLAFAFKVSRVFHVGVSIGLADSFASLDFDRDSALEPHGCAAGTSPGSCAPGTWPGGSATVATTGYENPRYAERIRVRGDGGNNIGIPSPSGLALALGALYRPGNRLTIGLSWSRMFSIFNTTGRYGSSSVVGATVTPPAAGGTACPYPSSGGSDGNCHGSAVIDYELPDVWSLGARVRLSSRLELSTWVRLVIYGGYPPLGSTITAPTAVAQRSLVLHLAGDPANKGFAPERIVLGRALVPAVAGEVGLRYSPSDKLRFGGSLVAESSAVPADHVDAAALDAPKLDGMIAVEWRVTGRLRLMLGYEITGLFFPPSSAASPGAYDPSATVRCVDARYAVAACQGAISGTGLPTAAGSYSLFDHRIALGFGLDL